MSRVFLPPCERAAAENEARNPGIAREQRVLGLSRRSGSSTALRAAEIIPTPSRGWLSAGVLLCFLFLSFGFSNCPCRGSTFTVSNALDSGPGSFRQAILDANASAGADTIVFQIPGSGVHTLTPATALPPLLDSALVDGTTQPGYAGSPLIEINGANAGNNSGLRVLSGHCTIQALAVNRFAGSGIQLEGEGTNTVRGCFIGIDPSGTVARPNGLEGVWIYNSSGNLVGGTDASARNVISGNSDSGVYIQNGEGNIVQGNFIGVSATGTAALGNAVNGITLYSAPGNRLGSASAGARNIISGNRGSGIYLYGSAATENLIQGNFIGTIPSGGGALSNAADGITFNGAGGNLVGGTNSGEGNLISGNGKAGIFLYGSAATRNRLLGNRVGTDVTGRVSTGNSYAGVAMSSAVGNWVGGDVAAAGNLISGNRQDGVLLSTNSTGNTVSGNLIGTDITGTNSLPNLFNGVSIFAASSNVIGGTPAAARNVVSGNAYYGIQIGNASVGNAVQGNFIGPDTTGARALRNGLSGMRIESAANLVGGASSGAGNVLSGNGLDGVMLVGIAASNNVVQGNLVGLAFGGNAPLPNGRAGVGISGAPGNVIGGAEAGAANVLSANTDAGVYLTAAGASGNQILGNRIGTDQSGTLALGNTLEGVYLENAAANFIGGSAPGAGNLISANHTRGIYLTNASWNRIQGNLIGTKADGISPLGNTFHNVECERGANNNSIGGPGTSAGNRIAFAQGIYAGVRIRDGSTNNSILGNSSLGNGALGIDLGAAGITPNDACDADTGANQLQNWPVLTQAVSGAMTGLRGSLNGVPGQAYLLQFFASPTCDGSGAGEGELYLGDATVVPSAACNATFVASLPARVPAGYVVTATATDSAGNTSEFSTCATVSAVPPLQYSVTSDHQLLVGWASSPSGFVLKQAPNLLPPITWSDIPLSPGLTNGLYWVKLPMSGPGNRFFMLTFQ